MAPWYESVYDAETLAGMPIQSVAGAPKCYLRSELTGVSADKLLSYCAAQGAAAGTTLYKERQKHNERQKPISAIL